MSGQLRNGVLRCTAMTLVSLLVSTVAGRADVVPRIVNGVETFDFPTTGAVLYSGGGGAITIDNATLYCTGTLIGCHTLLTAAHCVANDSDPTHYWVYLQNAGVLAVAAVSANPNYTPNLGGNDVATLTLANDVTGIAPTPINSTHDLSTLGVGLPGTVVGFGLSAITANDVGIKRYGAVQTADCVTSVTGGQGNDKLVCWDFAIPVGPPGTDSDTCNGDSGGPLFMDFNGVTEVVGVTVAGSSLYCRPLDHAWDASVYYNAAWIQSQLGTDSTTTCGGIGPVGSPAVSVIGNSGTLAGTNYSFTVDVGSNASALRVALNGQDNHIFNVDLYVKQGTGASPSTYDCKADGLSVFGGCEFPNPAAGTWSVFVSDAASAGLYQVVASVFAGPSLPPTATPSFTLAPPTATATFTPVPPTATPTDTPVPPTLTATATATATAPAHPKKTHKPTRTPKR